MTEKRCLYCETLYIPYGRLAKRQKVCGAAECVAKHKRAMDRRWWAARPERRRIRNAKKRQWAEKRGYWLEYRARHPEYAARNREQSRKRLRERRALAAVLRRPVEYLDGLKAPGGQMFANQDLLAKTTDGEPGVTRMFANFRSIDGGGVSRVK